MSGTVFPPVLLKGKRPQQYLPVRNIDVATTAFVSNNCSSSDCAPCQKKSNKCCCQEQPSHNKPFCFLHCLGKMPQVQKIEGVLQARFGELELAFSKNPADWRKINIVKSTFCSDLLEVLSRCYTSPSRLALEAGLPDTFLNPFLQILRENGYVKVFRRRQRSKEEGEKGLFKRKKSDPDMRIVSITEKGKELATKLWPLR